MTKRRAALSVFWIAVFAAPASAGHGRSEPACSAFGPAAQAAIPALARALRDAIMASGADAPVTSR
jgi:hypothetical protein